MIKKEIEKWEELSLEEDFKAYPQEDLTECQCGKVCSYGICDECPNNN